ncbi:MAG TPA: N-acetyltransferase [Nitrososphaeria archaeon]|jgi:acetyltransferase-like isoleucine patch superfamily enzyme|uniref:Acetyl/acyl transferase related protein n=1 Tax=Conexivisphaera calida TaxID=1874277 RepID=A0A4P2VHY0_9ARCH|nr:acyltransferase [Conexivisphaera calida]MDP7982567.1 acyltransferase [Conexivisphaerales archaeon]BBE43003.1 Acetyl/acyl transferase related protein [Conexivisphaera calida]HEU16985.1 N-acetyltransferase [Nitrososphaeria archaeon]
MSVVNHVGKNVKMGKNVKIWHYAYVGDNVEIGDDVMIGSLAHVDRDVKIGSGTRIQGLVYIPPLTVIGRNVFVGPAAVFTNDPYPPSNRMIGVTVEDEAVIGARSVILAGVTVGRRSVVAMGSVVVRDVPPETVVAGVPARIMYSREEYDRKRSAWESGGSARPHP